MCLLDLFLYRSTEFLAVYKIHFFSSFEQGTLDFDITLSRLGQKRKGSGRNKLALFSEQNTKVLQFFSRKLMNRIFSIGTFVFWQRSLIHAFHQNLDRFFVIGIANLPQGIIGHPRTFQLQFLQNELTTGAAGSIDPHICRRFFSGRLQVIRPVGAREYFYFKNRLSLQCFSGNICKDLGCTGIGDHIGDRIRKFERILFP